MIKHLSGNTLFAILSGLFLCLVTLLSYYGLLQLKCVFSVQTHLLLHLIGVILFMGNMVIGPVWFLFAWYSGKRELLSFSGKLLALTDSWITIPGMYLCILNGLCLAPVFGGMHAQPWMHQSLLLLFVMWFLTPAVIWTQEKMLQSIEMEPYNSGVFKKYMFLWSLWGSLVMLPPSLIFYLMIAKQAF